MILILFVIFILFSILNMVIFHGSVLMGVLTILFSIGGIVLRVGKFGLPKKAVTAAVIGCVLLGILTLCGAGLRKQSGNSIRDYEDRLYTVQKLLMDGKLDKAVQELKTLEKQYGTDDNTQVLWALENLVKENFEEAYVYMNQVSDKQSQLYYAVMERICIQDPSDKSVGRIYEIYLEAAKQWPDWTHMQKYAGITYFEQNNYSGAQYYLSRAFAQDSTDYRVAYYLGAVAYYQGSVEQCRQYFNEAIKLGADDDTCAEILWYMEQMEAR